MHRHRQLVILWEGAGWSDLNDLLGEGKMPNLAKLVSDGVMGKTQSVLPMGAESGAVSLASGQAPHSHGVYHKLAGSSPTVPLQEVGRGDWSAVWDRLAGKGDRCIEVGWPLGHPASSRLAAAVSDRFAWPADLPQFRFCLPSDSVAVAQELEDLLRSARVVPSELGVQILSEFLQSPVDVLSQKERLEVIRRALAQIYSIHAAALILLEKVEWDVGAVSYPCLAEFFRLSQQEGITFQEKEVFYQLFDSLLGVLLTHVPSDTVVHLVSSHSYETSTADVARQCDEGIWVMSGPGVLSDQLIHGGHVLDVAPTVWALRGEPPFSTMVKKPRLDLLSEGVEWFPREGELPEGPESADYQLPWDHLLQDGRVRKLVRLEQLGEPRLVKDLWRSAQVGEFRSLQQMGCVEQACEKGERLFELFPDDFEVALIYSQCLVEKRHWGRLEDFIQELKAKYDASHQQREILFVECALLQQRGEEGGLFERLEGLQKNELTAQQWIRIAAFYRSCQRFEEALKIYFKVAEDHPAGLLPWLMIAKIHQCQDKYEEAEQVARHLITLDPRLHKGHLLLAASLYRQGKKEEARRAFERFEECAGRVRSFRRYRRVFWES